MDSGNKSAISSTQFKNKTNVVKEITPMLRGNNSYLSPSDNKFTFQTMPGKDINSGDLDEALHRGSYIIPTPSFGSEDNNHKKETNDKNNQNVVLSNKVSFLVPVMGLPEKIDPIINNQPGMAVALHRLPPRNQVKNLFYPNLRPQSRPIDKKYGNIHRVPPHLIRAPPSPRRSKNPPGVRPIPKSPTYNPRTFRRQHSVQRDERVSSRRHKVSPHKISRINNNERYRAKQYQDRLLNKNKKAYSPRIDRFRPFYSMWYDRYTRRIPSSSLKRSYPTNPRYSNRNNAKQKYDLHRGHFQRTHRRQIPSNDYRRKSHSKPYSPPIEFRYPPTAANIQDIIEYMSGDEGKSEKLTPDITNKDHLTPNQHTTNQLPSEFILGDQNHVIGNYPFVADPSHEQNINVESEFEQTLHMEHDIKTDIHNLYPHSSHNYKDEGFRPIPNLGVLDPVRNTYNPYTNNGNKPKNDPPFELMLDIYPALDSSTPINKFQSLLTVTNKDMHKIRSGRNSKQEIILRLNFFTNPPFHRTQ